MIGGSGVGGLPPVFPPSSPVLLEGSGPPVVGALCEYAGLGVGLGACDVGGVTVGSGCVGVAVGRSDGTFTNVGWYVVDPSGVNAITVAIAPAANDRITALSAAVLTKYFMYITSSR